MSLRRGDALIVVGLIGFLVAVSLTAPRWARLLFAPTEDSGDETPAPVPTPPPSPAAKRIGVKLYFESAELPVLVAEDRDVPFSPDLSQQVRVLVEELARGSQSGNLAPVPPETRVLAVFVSEQGGVVYLDLSGEAASGQPGGTTGERLAVYAIVNSITANLPALRRVQILIDDKPAETLAGHIDLSRPLWPDMSLVALVPPEGESPAPEAEPAAPQPAVSPAGAP